MSIFSVNGVMQLTVEENESLYVYRITLSEGEGETVFQLIEKIISLGINRNEFYNHISAQFPIDKIRKSKTLFMFDNIEYTK